MSEPLYRFPNGDLCGLAISHGQRLPDGTIVSACPLVRASDVEAAVKAWEGTKAALQRWHDSYSADTPLFKSSLADALRLWASDMQVDMTNDYCISNGQSEVNLVLAIADALDAESADRATDAVISDSDLLASVLKGNESLRRGEPLLSHGEVFSKDAEGKTKDAADEYVRKDMTEIARYINTGKLPFATTKEGQNDAR